jgi:hypothetical protein
MVKILLALVFISISLPCFGLAYVLSPRRLKRLKRLGRAGTCCSSIQCRVSMPYGKGGDPKDDAEAVKWFRKAAEQG